VLPRRPCHGGNAAVARGLRLSRGKRRLMRILCPIVQSFVLPMFDRQTHLLTSRVIARKLISDHDTWRIAQALQKLLKETCGGFRVALALDKNVEDIAILKSRHRDGGQRQGATGDEGGNADPKDQIRLRPKSRRFHTQ